MENFHLESLIHLYIEHSVITQLINVTLYSLLVGVLDLYRKVKIYVDL